MISLFVICAVIGLVWQVLEAGAKASSVAPSMYRTSGNGWILIIIGIVGALCSAYLP